MQTYTKKINPNLIAVAQPNGRMIKVSRKNPLFPAIERLNQYEELNTEKTVTLQEWLPVTCPTCGASLSKSLGDGYYKHDYNLERCPECNQKLKWPD